MCIKQKKRETIAFKWNNIVHQNTSSLLVWSIYKQTFYWLCRVKLRDTETAKENTEVRFSANTGVCQKHEN